MCYLLFAVAAHFLNICSMWITQASWPTIEYDAIRNVATRHMAPDYLTAGVKWVDRQLGGTVNIYVYIEV